MRPSLLWRPLCGSFFFSQVCAQKHSLVQRAVSSSTSLEQAAPTPLSISASQKWDGPDGPWSSFTIRVGTPERDFRVLISTASQQTWVILPDGCRQTDTVCPDARGGTYNFNTSSSWSRLGDGYFGTSIEQNLNLSAIGIYGHDTISLGAEGSGGPTLQDQLVGGIAVESYYLGMFGVNPKATNFPGVDGEQPSYLASLNDQNLIPSLSFGYTAGAQYRLNKVPGSLTLGGYDESRFTPNDLTFAFAPNNSRDLVVGVQSIVSTSQDGTVKSLLPAGILTYVDSTVPQIWLPIEACHAFEAAFGLVYDEESELYLVNSTLHDKLIAQKPSITFVLGQLQTGGKTVNITLPYDSFDLQATPPFVQKKTTRYFPLQRAKNDTQYTLGRTFLQEAYLIVDWERRNFSLSQCSFTENSPQKILAIAAPSTSPESSKRGNSGSSSSGKKIGIGVGVALAVILIAGIFWFIFSRRRKRQNKLREDKKPEVDEAEFAQSGHEKAELNADNEHAIHEKGDFDNDQRPGQPKTLASRRSWGRDEELSGGTLAIGELSADRVTGGLSPSEPLLGQRHELQRRPGSQAPPFELPAEHPSELPGSSPEKVRDGLPESSSDPSPISQPGSTAPSSPIYGHWGVRRGTRSSTHRSLITPSSPSHPPGDLSSSPESETFHSSPLADDPERGRGQGGLFSFFKGKSRVGRSTREM